MINVFGRYRHDLADLRMKGQRQQAGRLSTVVFIAILLVVPLKNAAFARGPSPTPTPTAAPSATPTPTAAPSATPTPTVAPSPTPTATLTPASPTPTPTPTPCGR